MTSPSDDCKPKIGMRFDNIEAASQFWLAYAEHTGFGVRLQYTNKRKKDGVISSCRFVCSKEGVRGKDKRDVFVNKHRAETRTYCKARISLILKDEKLVIHEFVEEDNHPLQLPETTHMLASHRKITEVQAYEIDMVVLMSTQAGHSSNVGFIRKDVKNYLTARRQRSMAYGEAGCLSDYFDRQLLENPSFFHAYQLDIDEQITNVFWVDANMLLDYGYFGDVVSLDTTYCTNRANSPLALFSGFNHYRGCLIFGAALLYDETTESFKWLFQKFLQAHNQKKPVTIFTDQDQAMTNALAEVMPETRHGLCTWHLLQNGVKNLGSLMKEGSYLLRDFKKCMYDIDTEIEFEAAWKYFKKEYGVGEREWIKSCYKLKEKWASCFMKDSYTLGMRSTQLSESLNSNFKSCMNPNVDINQFFKHFERVVEEKRSNELTCEYEARHKLPMLRFETSPILIQMAKVYTHTMFDLFQSEFKLFLALCITEKNESNSLCEYVITMVNHERCWKVSFDRASTSLYCSCKKFETFGILCSHALKVFEANDIKVIPEKYIIARWTKEARNGIVHDVRGKEVVGDMKLSSTRMFRQLVYKFIRLAADVSTSEKYHKVVDNGVDALNKQVMELRLQDKSMDGNTSDTPTFVRNDVVQPKGFKHRLGLKRNYTRLKSFIEKRSTKRKGAPTRRQPRRQASEDNGSTSHQQPIGVPCSAPPAYKPPQFSYTRFLMAPLDDTNTPSLDDISFNPWSTL